MGEAPYQITRSSGNVRSPGTRTIAASSAGTRKVCVIPLARSSSTATGSGLRRMRTVAPWASPSNAQLIPPTWKSGIATCSTSAPVMSASAAPLSARASRPRWVSIAPFGKPVVPEV
jgi:hypothetical protein